TPFQFTANVADDGTMADTNFTLRNGESKLLAGILPGNGYRVAETAKTGWGLSTATCSDGSSVTTIDVEAGETVTCTFANIQQGTLIVRKVTDPELTDTAFSFTADNTLAPNSFTLTNGQMRTFDLLDARSGYRVRELAMANWQLTSSTCSNGSPTTNICIDPGATTTCIFRNAGTLVDLHIAKTDGGITAEPGDTIVYTLLYRNDGTQDAAAVVVTEQVPANTVFVGPGAWSCAVGAPAGTLCRYAVGNLGARKTGQIPFKVKVNEELPSSVTHIHNLATVGYLEAANVAESSEDTPVKLAAELSLSKDDDGATAEPGGAVLYTLNYSNQGNLAVNNVVITETVPLHTTFVGPSALWNCPVGSPSGTVCTQSIARIGANESGASTFSVKVVSALPPNVTMIENRAQIGTAALPNADIGTEPTELRASPDLTVNITNKNESAIPGGIVRYRITFANIGTQGATNVVITKNIPTYTSFRAAPSSNG
ncbi:MAG: DUF11 domain-containing protein, partial [Caldilineaceae bacterium]|nr:DUF11 domain-containing protein [Caldilineaceae bacterium]